MYLISLVIFLESKAHNGLWSGVLSASCIRKGEKMERNFNKNSQMLLIYLGWSFNWYTLEWLHWLLPIATFAHLQVKSPSWSPPCAPQILPETFQLALPSSNQRTNACPNRGAARPCSARLASIPVGRSLGHTGYHPCLDVFFGFNLGMFRIFQSNVWRLVCGMGQETGKCHFLVPLI